MAANTFLIGTTASSDPDDWSVLATLLSSSSSDVSVARALDWGFEPYSKYVKMSSGDMRGLGYPVVTWRFAALRIGQRENLRDFVPDVTSDVYIRTQTNETVSGVAVWKDYLCKATWRQGAEVIETGLGNVRMVEIKFTNCVDVT